MPYPTDNPIDGRGEAASEAQAAQPMDAKWRAVLCREIGVWHVEGPHACFGIRTELATVWRAGGGAEERARLMAAAPELLAALRPQLSATARKLLEGLAEALEAMGDAGDRQSADAIRFLLDRQDAARAAIARAEGR